MGNSPPKGELIN